MMSKYLTKADMFRDLGMLTREELRKGHEIYVNDSSLRSELRFGQYMWNKHGPAGYKWTELFYETDNGKAYNMLYQAAN